MELQQITRHKDMFKFLILPDQQATTLRQLICNLSCDDEPDSRKPVPAISAMILFFVIEKYKLFPGYSVPNMIIFPIFNVFDHLLNIQRNEI